MKHKVGDIYRACDSIANNPMFREAYINNYAKLMGIEQAVGIEPGCYLYLKFEKPLPDLHKRSLLSDGTICFWDGNAVFVRSGFEYKDNEWI